MFTGIIEKVGIIKERKRAGSAAHLFVSSSFNEPFKTGESIAVDGVCLTVADFDKTGFSADVVGETLRSTTLGEIRVGEKVNLERAMKMGERLGGHLVSGHIDGAGKIISIGRHSTSSLLKIEAPFHIMQFLINKGSIAVDGISLTVQGLSSRYFSVAVIPHTLQNTNLCDKRRGAKVNLEIDMIAKYVKQLTGKGNQSSLTLKGLREQGF